MKGIDHEKHVGEHACLSLQRQHKMPDHDERDQASLDIIEL